MFRKHRTGRRPMSWRRKQRADLGASGSKIEVGPRKLGSLEVVSLLRQGRLWNAVIVPPVIVISSNCARRMENFRMRCSCEISLRWTVRK